jgi:hypothetical protein
MPMKSIAGPLVAAIVTALAGAALWTTGQTTRRLADVRTQLATLRYTDADANGAKVERTLEGRVAPLARPAVADVGEARTASAYWRADYSALEPARDAGGAITETSPVRLLTAANAMFRVSQTAADRNESIRRLDAAVKAYADALKAQAAACDAAPHVCDARATDAAYNYEFAIRARDAAARAKGLPRAAAHATPAAPADESDLPSGPTLHGKPGAPPSTVDFNEFKMVIPKAGEERKGAPDAGKGGAKVRKG